VLGIAGLINPGNRVDVLVTINDPDKNDIPITKIVLENLLVLATGTQIVENSEGKPAPVDVFTLEVSPEQGERLTLAANKGKLQFALRGAADTDIVLTKGITVPELLKSHLILEKEKTPPQVVKTAKSSVTTRRVVKRRVRRTAKSQKATVEIIKGLEIEKETIRL
jgi:pilus assembly protein CpaB